MTRAPTPLERFVAQSVPEKSFQASVITLAKLYKWRVYFTFNSRHSPHGWPDLVLVKPPRIIFAELKAEKGALTPQQSETLIDLRECGLIAVVWRPSQWREIETALGGEGVDACDP